MPLKTRAATASIALTCAALAFTAGAAAPVSNAVPISGVAASQGLALASSTLAQSEPVQADTAALREGVGGWINTPVRADALDDGVVIVIPLGDNGAVQRSDAGAVVALQSAFLGRPVKVMGLHADSGWRIFTNRARVLGLNGPVAHDAGNAWRTAMTEATGVDLPAAWVIGPGDRVQAVEGDVYASAEAVGAALATIEPAPEPAGTSALTDADDIIPGRAAPAGADDPLASSFTTPGGWSPRAIPGNFYAAAEWPAHNDEPNGTDRQGRAIPLPMNAEDWQTDRPSDFDKRVLIVDFPDDNPAYREQSEMLDAARERFAGEVEVFSITNTREPADARVLLRRLRTDRPAANDINGEIQRRFAPEGRTFAALLSTDGVVRWQGDPMDAGFEEALAAIVAADPLLGVRRGEIELSEADRDAAAVEWRESVDEMRLPATASNISASNRVGSTIEAPYDGLDWLNVRRGPEGDAPVVLSFWATWCPPCRAATPMIEAIQEHYADDLRIIAVGGQSENRSTVMRYVRAERRPVAHAFAKDQDLYKYFGVRGIPHTVVLDREGTVVWQGNPHSSDLRKAVEFVVQQDRAARFDERG